MARDTNITVRLRDRFSQGMTKLGRGVRGLRQRFFNLRTAVIGVVAALGAFSAARGVSNFLVDAVKTAQSFEEQMSTVRAVTGATAQEFDALNKAAEEAGRSTRFTATEAGQGLENLTRAGFNARQAIDALNPTLNLAQANAIEVAEAASLITTTLNQYGEAADQAGRVSDIFTRAAQRADTTVTDLGEAFSYAGPLAAQAGTNIEDTAALLASMADQGFRGSRAGTALTRMFIELQNPSSKFREELQKLGINTTDAVEVIEKLGAEGEGARDALLALGQRGGPAIAALVNEGIPKIQALRGELRSVEGTAKNAAAIMDDNLGGALKNLGSAFEGLQIELVSDLMDRLKDEVFELANAIREFTKSEAFQRLKEDLAAAFDSAVRSLKSFLAEFDFQDATRRLGQFVRDTGQKTDELIRGVQVFGRTAKGISAGIRVAFNSLDVAISRTVQSFAFATRKVFELDNAIAEKVPGWRKHTEALAIATDVERRAAERAEQAHIDLGNAIGDLQAAMAPLSGSTHRTADGLDRTGAAGERAKGGIEQATDALEEFEVTAKRIPSSAAAIEAAMQGVGTEGQAAAQHQAQLTDELKRQNPTLKESGRDISTIADQTSTWQTVLKILKGEQQEVGEQTERTKDQTDELGRTSRDAADGTQQLSDAQREATATSGGFAQALGKVLGAFRSISAGMARAQDEFIRANGDAVDTLGRFFQKLGRFQKRQMQIYEQQKTEADLLLKRIEGGVSAQEALGLATRNVRGQFDLLNESDLSRLESAIDSVRSKAEAFRSEIDRAVESVETDLARARGNEEELLEREFDQRRRELELALDTAIDLNRKKRIREAIRQLEELREIRLEELRERQEAEREGNEQTHRQRERNSREFHEGEMSRTRERAKANSGSIRDYNEADREAQEFHERELRRIEEQKAARLKALEAEEAKREQLAAAGGRLAGGRTSPVRLDVNHRVLSDALNGAQMTLSPEQMRHITEAVIQALQSDRRIAGLYGHG